MIWAFFKHSMHFHFDGRLKQGLLIMLCVMAFLFGFAHSGSGPVSESLVFPLVILFGAGILGRDFSHGGLALVFSRPVQRWQYVLARWAAMVVWVMIVILALTIIGAARASVHGWIQPDLRADLNALLPIAGVVMSLGALATLFSAFGKGYTNVGIYLAAWFFIVISKVPKAAVEIATRLLVPGAGLLEHSSDPLVWLEWFGLTAAYLVAAIWIVSKREIGYSR